MSEASAAPIPPMLLKAVTQCDTTPQALEFAVDLKPLARERRNLTVAWIPVWYASDQELLGGLWVTYQLQARGSAALKSALEETGFHGLFHSERVRSDATFGVTARIDRIFHGKLGELREIRWSNNMYRVTLASGFQFNLDDEEGAGWCDFEGITPEDWNLRVELTVMCFLTDDASETVMC